MSASPSITVPADSTYNMHGYSTATINLPVTDSGRTPIIVTGRVASISPKAVAHPALSWVTSVGPHGMHLAPGQTGFLTITVRVPAGASPGPHYVNVIAGAAPLGHHGMAAEAAAVGGTLRISHAGHVAVPAHHAAQGPASGGDAGWLVLAVVLVLALALAGLALILRRRHHGVHQ